MLNRISFQFVQRKERNCVAVTVTSKNVVAESLNRDVLLSIA